MKYMIITTYLLMFIGALNWGLIGLLDFDLVATLFGEMSVLSRSVYSLVGFSAIVNLMFMFSDRAHIGCPIH